MITPAGAPSWVKANDHTTYGGNVNKHNYQSQGAVNPLTDVTAEQFCRLCSDVSANARTAAVAELTYLCNDAVPAAPTIETIDSPIGTPTATRNGNGDVTFTWLASYQDEFLVSGNIHLAHQVAQLIGSVAGVAMPEPLDLDLDGRYESVRVRAIAVDGSVISDARVTLTVSTGTV